MKTIFKVEDFLKIEKAEIDITNFCVFIGNNNSGKTKLMELIYGVLDYLTKRVPQIEYNFRANKVIFDEKKIEKLICAANKILSDEKEEILQSIFNKDLSIGSMQLEVPVIDRWYEIYRLSNGNSDVLYDEDIRVHKDIEKLFGNTNLFLINVCKDKEGTSKEKLCIIGIQDRDNLQFIKARINKIILSNLLGLNIEGVNSHLFFPASRMGLAMLYKEYFNSIGNNEKIWMRKDNSFEDDTYQQSDHVTKPVLDFLRFLQGYSYNISNAKQNIDLIEFVNEHLLEGGLDEKGEVATYTPQNSDIRVPLYLASSMINELDPIIKMLTDRNRTSMLFYDEIETSLHPLKQLEMVKLLNRLNNNGMRIILATHSDTFVTKMNNLLLLARSHKIGEQPVSIHDGKVKISREDLLETEDIHVYQFINKDNGRSEVNELEFKTAPMIGYSFELFEDSSTSLYEETKLALGIE